MFFADGWRQRTFKHVGLTVFLLALLVVPLQHALAGGGAGITVTSHVDVGNLGDADEIILVGITPESADGEPLFSVSWIKDTSGWFPSWNLMLTAAPGLLPSDVPAKPTGDPSGTVAFDLGRHVPATGHNYEASMSYSPEIGALAVRIVDETDGRVLYSDGFSVAAYDEPLVALKGTAVPTYLPIGSSWNPGVREEGRPFLALQQYATRGESAVVRLLSPAAVPGAYRLTLETDEGELHIASVTPEERETWIPLPLSDFPLGASALRLDYVVDGEVLLTETRPVGVGHLEFWLAPMAPEPEQGVVKTMARVRGAEPFEEEFTLNLSAALYELVWDEEARKFNEVPGPEVPLFNGPIDLSVGDLEIPLQLDMPEEPASWKIVVSADVSPHITMHIGGHERLFSSHRAADVEVGESYTIAVFPDTQYFASSYPEIFTRMADWVAANAEELKIAALLHVGDITNNDTAPQWERAYRSMSLLHGVVPYVLTLGNHDMTNGAGGQVRSRGLSLINNYFTVEEATKYSNLAGTMVPGRLENHYHLFSIGGTDYLVIALEFGPPDEALVWANEIAQQYPDHKMILLTHSYLTRNGNRSPSPAGYPLADNPDTTVNTATEMWNKLLRNNANSFMVISGHTSPPVPVVPYGIARATTGQRVYELLFDWQTQDNGGNGWLGLLTFHPDNTVEIRVVSPYLGEYANERDANGFTSHLIIHVDTGLVRRLQN